MYEIHFGLEKNPFSMTSDPTCLFMTEQHREAIAGLVYAIRSRKGLLVLTGEVGTGKTTVLSRVVRHLPRNAVQFAVILHPTLTPDEFIEMVMLNLGITDIPASKALRLNKLQNFLLNCQKENKVAALIIDEAHKLSPEVLEEVRLLGNLDSVDQKLLQLVLVGQSELDDMMRREEFRQLKQRVALRVSLKALGRAEVHDYMNYRWQHAGGKQELPFTADAVSQVIYWSSGFPRLINSLCDQSMLLAFGNGSQKVEASYVKEAARDLDLTPLVAAPSMPEAPVKTTPGGTYGSQAKASRPISASTPATASAPLAMPARTNGATVAVAEIPASVTAAVEPSPAAKPPSLAMVGGIRVPDFGGYARPKRPLLYRMAIMLGFRTR